jgi:signal transduction histidine kinase
MDAPVDVSELFSAEAPERFRQPPQVSGLFGFRQVLWYRTTIPATILWGEAGVLELPYTLFAYVDAWILDPEADAEGVLMPRRYGSGMSRPFAQRALPHATQTFPLPASNGDIEVLLRIVTGAPLHFEARVWSGSDWQRNVFYTNLWYGVLLGGTAILLLYNLFLAAALRDASYVYYVAYLLAMTMLIVDISGLRHQYLPLRELSLVYLSIAAVFGVTFCNHFLRLHHRSPRLAMVGVGIAVLAGLAGLHYLVAVLLGVVLIPGNFSLLAPLVASGLASIYYLAAPVYAYLKGVREARFLIPAFGVIFIGFYWHALRLMGLADPGFAIHHIIEASVLAEAILLALALADRINLLSEAKDRAEAESQQAQMALSQRIFELQESDRQHFATVLHDAIGHGLLVLRQRLDRLEQRGCERLDADELMQLRDHCGEIMDEVRSLSHELHPHILQRLGLKAALQSLLERSFHGTGTDWTLQMQLDEQALGVEQTIALYRVVQEAVSNVLKHANAGEVMVKLTRNDGNAVAEIKDDGSGTSDPHSAAQGIGLTTMRGRVELLGGWFRFDALPGGGARVVCTLPLRL